MDVTIEDVKADLRAAREELAALERSFEQERRTLRDRMFWCIHVLHHAGVKV